ncbi:activating transcription factor 7-interacting protein 1 isoform X1 [Parasteatoda tepidariorum]|uniref:activating transcription factor 7-interacting protein 1 isoform X1 n=1 Tax=Parasteatoda tepidariorum TaxID=114398 RepID=UPI001C71A2B5|nr:protein PFC0760c isoform X1 [Parasteatoda tepidariorum]
MKMDCDQNYGSSSVMNSVESIDSDKINLGSEKETGDHREILCEDDCNNGIRIEVLTEKQGSSSVLDSGDHGLVCEKLFDVTPAINVKKEADESEVNDGEKCICVTEQNSDVLESTLEQKTNVIDVNKLSVTPRTTVSTDINSEIKLVESCDKSCDDSVKVNSNVAIEKQGDCSVGDVSFSFEINTEKPDQKITKKLECKDLAPIEKCPKKLDVEDKPVFNKDGAENFDGNASAISNVECALDLDHDLAVNDYEKKSDCNDPVILNEKCTKKLGCKDPAVLNEECMERFNCDDLPILNENSAKELVCDNTLILNEKCSEELVCYNDSIVSNEDCSKILDSNNIAISNKISVKKLDCSDSAIAEEKFSEKLDCIDLGVMKEECSRKLSCDESVVSREGFSKEIECNVLANSKEKDNSVADETLIETSNDIDDLPKMSINVTNETLVRTSTDIDDSSKMSSSDDIKLNIEKEDDKDDQFLILSEDSNDSISAHCIEMAIAESNEEEEKNNDEGKKEVNSMKKIDDDEFNFEKVMDESEDEIDSILPEFVNSEFADKDKSVENVTLSDSEAEMDSLIEAFKAEKSDSEDDCLIIEDDSHEIVLDDDKSDVKVAVTLSPIKVTDSRKDGFELKDTDLSVFNKEDIWVNDANVSSENNQNILSPKLNQKNEEINNSSTGSCKESLRGECESKGKGDDELKSAREPKNDDSSENSNVLDLINQNLESIVSLISESSNQKDNKIETILKNEVNINNSNLENSDSHNENKHNSAASEFVNTSVSSVEETVKDLLNELSYTLSKEDSSENSTVSDLDADLKSIELKNMKLLLESSSSENSLESLDVSSQSPKNPVELEDSVKILDVIESVETIVKDGLTAQLNSKPVEKDSMEVESGKDKENKQAEETELTQKCLPVNGDVFNDEPEVLVSNKIDGLLSVCNNFDYTKCSEKGSTSQPDSLRKICDNVEDNLNKLETEKSEVREETESSEENNQKDLSKKRKVEEEDDVSTSKKLKEDIVTNAETVSKFETKQSWLDKIAQDLCVKVVTDLFGKELKELGDAVTEMEIKLTSSSKDLETFKKQATEFYNAQETTFKENNYNPKVPTRTVGVNVKIFRECDIQSLKAAAKAPSFSPVGKPINLPSSVAAAAPVPKVIPSEKAKLLLSSLPKISPVTNRPPLVSTPKPQPIQQIRGVMQPAAVRNTAVLPQNKTGNQLIDLTEDTSSGNRRYIGSTNVVSGGTANKVNLPPGATQNNVLVPLNNFVQLIPSSQNISTTNAGQRQLMPSIPSNLLGQRAVGYTIYTPSAGSTNNMAMRGVPTLISNQNQRLQTYYVRVTNSSSQAPLSSIVNSSVRQPSLPHGARATLSSSSNLVVYSRSAPPVRLQHPAPFPQMASYPMRPGLKPVPPKPSLKGSRNASGIVLSWNIHSDLKVFADILSYQLFAYQETSGSPITAALWKPVGNVKALPLPMACTLTQFVEGFKYHFTIRAVDSHARYGPFSDPVGIMFNKYVANS